jgi:hypothetical protein
VPFLRVLRDKRGYETTYLVHWFRDGNKQRSRILYAFRTPPGVRVGREVLDPEVVRDIERQHPEIAFDWRALVEHKQVIDQAGDPRRPQRPRKKEEAATPPAPTEVPATPPPKPAVPMDIEGDTRERQLAFLARWYPELRERVPHRTDDPIRRAALLALVERLNAASWETEEQIGAGLQSAAEALQRLSHVFSKRRRRARRARTARAGGPAEAAPAQETGAAGEATSVENAESPSADEPA